MLPAISNYYKPIRFQNMLFPVLYLTFFCHTLLPRQVLNYRRNKARLYYVTVFWGWWFFVVGFPPHPQKHQVSDQQHVLGSMNSISEETLNTLIFNFELQVGCPVLFSFPTGQCQVEFGYFPADLRQRYVQIFLQAFKGSSLSGRSLFYASKVKGD